MNRLTNLVLSVGETLVHEGGRVAFRTRPRQGEGASGDARTARNPPIRPESCPPSKAVDGALLAGPRTCKEYAKFTLKKGAAH